MALRNLWLTLIRLWYYYYIRIVEFKRFSIFQSCTWRTLLRYLIWLIYVRHAKQRLHYMCFHFSCKWVLVCVLIVCTNGKFIFFYLYCRIFSVIYTFVTHKFTCVIRAGCWFAKLVKMYFLKCNHWTRFAWKSSQWISMNLVGSCMDS